MSEKQVTLHAFPELIEVMTRIAKALEAQAEATELLARATAGEFEPDEMPHPASLSDRG